MTLKNRITKLESKAITYEPPKENQKITAEMWERCFSTLADALVIEHADAETALKELAHE